MATAVEGGHVTDISASNRIIREIVESRNRSRAIDEDEEVARDVEEAADMDVSPLPEVAENPKDTAGSSKLPLHLFPFTAIAHGAIAMLNGALKYGRSNWRAIGIRASIYHSACLRHLAAWFEGEDRDAEGVDHLASALACIAILIDAREAGKLRDDRNYPGGYRETVESLTAEVDRLRRLHAGRDPKHYELR